MSARTQRTETVIEGVAATAKGHSSDVRMVRTIEIGQHCRQGDVYICRVSEKVSRGIRTKDTQLAPGTTKGSRHCVSGQVEVYAPSTTDPLVGPIIRSDVRFEVTHPEHADISLPSGTYQVTYQRDLAKEERARVMD